MIKVNIPFIQREYHMPAPRREEALAWCYETFGNKIDPSTKKYRWLHRDNWNDWEGRYYTYFYFTKEEHATWFRLKWSQ